MLAFIFSNDFEDDPLHKILSWRDPLQDQQKPSSETFKLV